MLFGSVRLRFAKLFLDGFAMVFYECCCSPIDLEVLYYLAVNGVVQRVHISMMPNEAWSGNDVDG